MSTRKRNYVDNVFAECSLRCTAQRRAIYECLTATTTHPTAEQLHQAVGLRVRGISLATVYNTLEAFCCAGLAKKLPGKGGSLRYDGLVHNHVHTHCEKTGAVHDVPEDLGKMLLESVPRKFLKRIEDKLGFSVHEVQIDLIGVYE